jgi:hypothetical protein
MLDTGVAHQVAAAMWLDPRPSNTAASAMAPAAHVCARSRSVDRGHRKHRSGVVGGQEGVSAERAVELGTQLL